MNVSCQTVRIVLLLVVGAGLAMPAGCAQFGAHDDGPDIRLDPAAFEPPPPCPVDGEPVNFALRVQRPDGVVFFSSLACIERFNQNPAAYADLVQMQRDMLKTRPRTQVICPITGEPASKERYSDLFGERVYFCSACDACPELYEAAPENYAAALEAGYTYQTRCPVTEREIDAGAFLELRDGRRIYFCCKRCRARYRSAPERFRANLLAQGVDFDAR